MNSRTQEDIRVSRRSKQALLHEHFVALLEQHSGIVFKVARTYCWHPDDRVELEQEIATQLWSAFPKYDREQLFSTWMYRIAFNVAISYVRHHARRQRHMVPYEESVHAQVDPERELSDDPRLELLQRFIESLDPLNRAIMVLYLEEHSYRTIAGIVGITETNVASKISRLKRRVRALDATQERRG